VSPLDVVKPRSQQLGLGDTDLLDEGGVGEHDLLLLVDENDAFRHDVERHLDARRDHRGWIEVTQGPPHVEEVAK
jgi:hypothetical protein